MSDRYEKMDNVFVPNQVKKDFMKSSSGSKGSEGRDPMMGQTQPETEMDQEEIDNIYRNKMIAQNIIDIPAEDCTREWIGFKDTPQAENLMNKLNDLNAQQRTQDMVEYERLTGDGLISIGANQSGAFDISDELDEEGLKSIDYLHSFSRKKLLDGMINEDPFSKDFNKFEYYELEPLNQGSRLVHSSRVLHMQSRVFEGEKWGTPLMKGLKDPIKIVDSFAWSLGQIAYAMTFKVYKSPHMSFKNKSQAQNVAQEMEKFFNTMSMAVIGKDEELTHESPGGNLPNLEAMSKFIWDYLSGAARMPKAHILGQQQGAITGGKYDSLNYYMRISGMQENYIRPLIERIVDLLYMCSDNDINGEPDYNMIFKPLWKLDQETDAKIRKMNAEIEKKKAETAKIYTEQGIYGVDEIRAENDDEKLFEKFDTEGIAEDVRERYKEVVKNG